MQAKLNAILELMKARSAGDARLPVHDLYALDDVRLVTELMTRLVRKAETQRLSAAELTIVCVEDLEGEVNNGGFNQFFFNSSGDNAMDVGEALLRVDLANVATLYDRALRAFPGTPSRDTGARRRQMEAVSEQTNATWSQLDTAYYALRVDLAPAVARFARSHQDEIHP